MIIQLNCRGGQSLTARDEESGKRVKCGAAANVPVPGLTGLNVQDVGPDHEPLEPKKALEPAANTSPMPVQLPEIGLAEFSLRAVAVVAALNFCLSPFRGAQQEAAFHNSLASAERIGTPDDVRRIEKEEERFSLQETVGSATSALCFTTAMAGLAITRRLKSSLQQK